jgi:hypothetical protein
LGPQAPTKTAKTAVAMNARSDLFITRSSESACESRIARVELIDRVVYLSTKSRTEIASACRAKAGIPAPLA